MSMPDPLSDDAFLAAFERCTLVPASFDHGGHLRAAWLMLQRYPLDDAITRTCQGIARLAKHFGAADKFHHTLTEAFVRLIDAHSASAAGTTWENFLELHPEFRTNARALISRYYSAECLAQPDARHRFIAPDRLPLPICQQSAMTN